MFLKKTLQKLIEAFIRQFNITNIGSFTIHKLFIYELIDRFIQDLVGVNPHIHTGNKLPLLFLL